MKKDLHTTPKQSSLTCIYVILSILYFCYCIYYIKLFIHLLEYEFLKGFIDLLLSSPNTEPDMSYEL